MRSQIRFLVTAAGLVAGACSMPEEVTYQPPIYCYQSLAAVTCLDMPSKRDEGRLVNYIGPDPELFADPPPPQPEPKAPAPVGYGVKDTEPVPRSAR